MNRIYKTLAFTFIFFLLYAIWEIYSSTYRSIAFRLPPDNPYDDTPPLCPDGAPSLEVLFYYERLPIYIFFFILSIIIVYMPYLARKIKDKGQNCKE